MKILLPAWTTAFALLATPATPREADVQIFELSGERVFQLLEPGYLPAPLPDRGGIPLAGLPLSPGAITAYGTPKQGAAADGGTGDGEAVFQSAGWRQRAPDDRSRTQQESDCSNFSYRAHPRLRPAQEAGRRLYWRDAVEAACRNGVPAGLFDALVVQESRYDTHARSVKGAVGLSQLMPATARDLGVRDRTDVLQNLEGGARYLRAQFDRFGDWRLALAAFNAGPGAVLKHGGMPPFRETTRYVNAILAAAPDAGLSEAAILTPARLVPPETAAPWPRQQHGRPFLRH